MRCSLCVWMVFVGWMGAAMGVEAASNPRVCKLKTHAFSWPQKARLSADTTWLTRHLKRQGYRLPRRGFALVTQVVPGVGQPAFRYVSLGKTGFVPSPGHFWPASTVKLWAAVGALMRMRAHRLDRHALLHFSDGMGAFLGTAPDLYRPMGNVEYDRLLRISSLQLLNGLYRKRFRYTSLVLKRGYGGTGSLRRTPAIRYLHAGRSGTLPAIRSGAGPVSCRKNCASLFALQDVLRRVVFHRKLPVAHRFPVSSGDVMSLKGSLAKQWKWVAPAVKKVLGAKSRMWNKAGSVPGNHLLDNVAIDSPKGRFLLSVATPWPRRQASVAPALRVLNELARQVLWGVLSIPAGPALQGDTGPSIPFALLGTRRGTRRFRVRVRHQAGVRVQVWHGTKRIRLVLRKGRLTSRPFRLSPGPHLFLVRTFRKRKSLSFRSFGFRIPGGRRSLRCVLRSSHDG
jgi:hypothetical protein